MGSACPLSGVCCGMSEVINPVKQYRVSDLRKHPNNPRIIKDSQYQTLKASIESNPELLEARPVILSDRTGKLTIIGGNQRYQVVKDLGWLTIPGVLFPDLSEEKERELMIRDNVSNGEWDFDALASDWDSSDLQEWGLDVPDWGGESNQQYQGSEDQDKVPDPEIKAINQIGDLWILGDHKLICGDSSDPIVFEKLLDSEKIEIVFTDPPYGVALADKNKTLNSLSPSARNSTEIKNDNLPPDELKKLLISIFTLIKKYSADYCSYYVAAPQGGELSMMMMMMADSGLPIRHVLIWVKNQPTFSMNRLDYDYQHEPILYCWNKRHEFQGKGQYKTSIWNVDKPRESKLHPTMKPVELVENALLNSSKQGWISFEPFCGSGTSLIAAEKTGRKCRAIELSEHYCDVIIRRWQDYTGREAILQSTGQSFSDVANERGGINDRP